ncbi:MAG: dipeptidase PepE [Actinomycetota bacterium]|nr:dipeptidase PepE [Actinomycetota bacterium]
MKVLLGSGGFRTPDRRRLLHDQMRGFFGSVQKLLFVPFAVGDHERYLTAMAGRTLEAGYELEGLHRSDDVVHALDQAEGLYIGGGNTFRLLTELYRRGLIEVIREHVLAGLPYMGISAGANVACPTIKTTNDMPIVRPPSFDAIGLVPFQLNAHYYPGPIYFRSEHGFEEHFGETRDERIAEFQEMNDAPVVGLREGGFLRVEDGQTLLYGAAARIFLKKRRPFDVGPVADIGPLLAAPLEDPA